MKKILILGIGNILQSDDGLGVYIVNEILKSNIPLPENVEVMDGGTAGFDLLSLMEDRKKIIIVDALKADDTPGSIYRFKPEHAVSSDNMFSLHQVGILEVIRFLKLLGHNPEIEIVGIVPKDIATLDISISNEVLKSVPKAIDVILEAALN